jgi:hypothetical protein
VIITAQWQVDKQKKKKLEKNGGIDGKMNDKIKIFLIVFGSMSTLIGSVAYNDKMIIIGIITMCAGIITKIMDDDTGNADERELEKTEEHNGETK